MLIDDIETCRSDAEDLSHRINEDYDEKAQSEKENEFIRQYNDFLENLSIIYSMDQIQDIYFKKKDYETFNKALYGGKKVYQTCHLSQRSKVIEDLTEASRQLSSIKKKWQTCYKDSDEVKKVLNMLSLISSVYKGVPSTNKLSNAIKSAGGDGADDATINCAMESLNQARNIIEKMDIDSDISSFLKKISNGTACLADLNGEIMEWLSENDLLRKMKITN